jgi:allantoin racemase
MRILVANPNATEAITEVCAKLARAAASPGTEVIGWTNQQGPPVIDSFYGDYSAGRPLVRALVDVRPRPDAIVLAGFGNYGTAALKEVLDIPVLGMAEATMALAVPFCHRFAILTTSLRMVPYTQDLVAGLGFADRCAAVRAVEVSQLDANELPVDRVVDALADAVRRIAAETPADLVILGGSRLSPFAAPLRHHTPMPILEPVACAVQMAEAAVRLGLRQSKIGKFAPPPRPLDEYG